MKHLVGEGGMGTVWRVRHLEWNIDLAVKMPLPEVVAGGANRERYIREAQIWIDLGVHPNLVQCLFVRDFHGILLLFLDYLTGGSLKDWLNRGYVKPGQWDRILDLGIQACDGLAYSHSRGVIHRDIKPANLLIRGDDRLCVTDFGIVKVTRVEEVTPADAADIEELLESLPKEASGFTLTGTGSLLGTPEYGAPEQWGKAHTVAAQADVYALGGVLYEMCAGRRAFDDGSRTAAPALLVGRHLSSPAPDPRKFNPDIPEVLAEVLLTCLAKKPEKRPSSMLELREKLVDIYQQLNDEPYGRAPPVASEQRADALNNRAVSFWYLGMPQEAMASWKEAQQFDAQHPEAVYNRSLVQWRQGEIEREEMLRRLSGLSGSGWGDLYLGYFLLESGDPERAEEVLKAAVSDDRVQGSGPGHRALGDAQMYLGKFYAAERSYKKALERMPEDIITKVRRRMAVGGSRRRSGHALFPSSEPLLELHSSADIVALAFDRAGVSCVCARADGLSRWDLESGVERWSWRREEASGGTASALAFAGDETYVVSLATFPGRVWSADTGECLLTLSARGRFLALAPDGEHALVADNSGLWLSRLPGGEELLRYEGHNDRVTCAAFSVDGKRIVSGDRQGVVRLWEGHSGHCKTVFSAGDSVRAVALAQGGGIAFGGGESGIVSVWESEGGTKISELEHSGRLRSLELDPEQRFLYIYSLEHGSVLVDVWRLGGSRMLRLRGPAQQTYKSGRLLQAAGEVLKLWDCMAARTVREFAGRDTIALVGVSGLARFAVTSEPGKTRVWELDEDHRVYERSLMVNRTRSHAESELSQQRFAAELDSAREAFATGNYARAYRRLNQARAVSGYARAPEVLALSALLAERLPRKTLRGVWESSGLQLEGPPQGVSICSKGTWAAVGQAAEVLVYEFGSGHDPVRLLGHEGRVNDVAISADGTRVVSAGADACVRVWDRARGSCFRVLPHAAPALQVILSGDGRFALCLTEAATLELWDLVLGNHLRSVGQVRGEQQVAAASADLRWGLTGPEMALWDLPSGKLVLGSRSFKEGGEAVSQSLALAVNGGGRLGVSANERGQILLWDLDDGYHLQTYAGHGERICCLALNDRLRTVMSGADDGSVKFWDAVEGECLHSLRAHRAGLLYAKLSAEGRFLLTAGRDGDLRLWELDWELDPESKLTPLADQFPRSRGALRRITSLFRKNRR